MRDDFKINYGHKKSKRCSFLIKVFNTDVLCKKSKSSRLILLLYASYQGHKESSKVLEKIIMKKMINQK